MKVQFLRDGDGMQTGFKKGDITEIRDEYATGDLIPRKMVKPVATNQDLEIAKLKRTIAKMQKAAQNKMQTGAAKTK